MSISPLKFLFSTQYINILDPLSFKSFYIKYEKIHIKRYNKVLKIV